MRASLYIGATGMKALGDGMNVITNNLANVSTLGYKQQDIQFADIWYAQQANMGDWWNAQENSRVALGQKGEGVLVNDVRTIFQQGAFESTNTVTDLAINGKGFFQVKDGQGREYYTRAGDFRPDNQGVWRNPEGLALMGYQLGADGARGGLAEVTVDKFSLMAPKASTELSMRFNAGQGLDHSANATSPYFSLLTQYNAAANPPISNTASGYSQGITLYDAEGNARQATIHFDGAPSSLPGSVVEYVITADGDIPTGGDAAENPDAAQSQRGPVMAGTLTFSPDGQLKDMSAYTPSNGSGMDDQGHIDLSAWSTAALSADGLPQMDIFGSTVSVDLGIRAAGGWQNEGTAADVGTNQNALAGMGGTAVVSMDATTNYVSSSPVTHEYTQDGYPEGLLNDVSIRSDGTVVGRYSNNQNQELWQIPICRFTSEYNLRREGNNLFAYTPECGQMEMGVAGTENYGTIAAYNIEQSNVDMAKEFVHMITTQRGFQANSKAITTTDSMLETVIGMKR